MFNFLCDSKKEIFIAVFSCLIGIILPKIGSLIKKFIIFVYRRFDTIKITFSDSCFIEDEKQFSKALKKLYSSDSAIDRLVIKINKDKKSIDPEKYSPSDIALYNNECQIVENYAKTILHFIFNKEAKQRLADFGLNTLEDYTATVRKIIKLFHGYTSKGETVSIALINDDILTSYDRELTCVVHLKKETVLSAINRDGHTFTEIPEGASLLFIASKLSSITDKNILKNDILPYLISSAQKKINSESVINGTFQFADFFNLDNWTISLN